MSNEIFDALCYALLIKNTIIIIVNVRPFEDAGFTRIIILLHKTYVFE